jgi:protein SCO1/2
MNDRGKIIAIYSGVAVISAALIGGGMYLSHQVPDQPVPEITTEFTDVGTPKEDVFLPIKADFTGVNQAGEQVKLSDLKGKVWIVSEFFAICPHCAVRNGDELKRIYEEFKDHPDFQMVCVSVDPETDTHEQLEAYGKALGADPKNWWFISHPNQQETHDYLEKTLGFFKVRERTDQLDRESNGRFAHDMGIMLVDREWNILGKWPLYDAKSAEGRKRDPHLYENLRADLISRLEAELEKNETAGTENLEEEHPAETPPQAINEPAADE